MEMKRESSANDVVSGTRRRGVFGDRPGSNGTWIYRPSVDSDGMDVEFVSYATIRDAIGTKSVTLSLSAEMAVGDALHELAAEYDGLEPLLFTNDGELRPHVNVLVNEENVRTLDGRATELHDGDTVALAPGVAGGREGEDA